MILLLKEVNNNGYRWIEGSYDNQKNIHIEADLESGEYFVFVLPEWGQKIYDLNLILRAKTLVRLERKVYEEGMIEEGCTDLSQRYGKLNQLSKNLCSYNCLYEDMGMIVENINNEKAVRAVASANGANAISLIIPCHRIIGSNGQLVGYGGGLSVKKHLLRLENSNKNISDDPMRNF